MLGRVVLQNQALLIVGPHRSGTSALTRVLNLLGVDLGTETLPPKFDNPHGYWEHRGVFDLHEQLLSRMGSGWHEYRRIPADGRQQEGVAERLEDLRTLVVREFGDSALWAVKDPRLCRLLPVWLDVLEDLRVDARFILVVRHPLEVARSLDARDDPFSWSKCILLVLADTMEALRHTAGRARVFVSYSQLLEDWRRVVDAISQELRLDWPRDPAEGADEINEFLQPSARHHRLALEDLEREPGFPTWGRELYEALEEACRGRTRELDERFPELYRTFTDSWNLFIPEIEHLHSHYQQLLRESRDRAHHAEVDLQKSREQLEALLSSRLFRYTRPLRQVWYRWLAWRQATPE